jgi:hypothetical protein
MDGSLTWAASTRGNNKISAETAALLIGRIRSFEQRYDFIEEMEDLGQEWIKWKECQAAYTSVSHDAEGIKPT